MRSLAIWFGFAALAAGVALAADAPKPKPVSFTSEIQPILKERCKGCHTGAEPSHNLVLDTPEDLFRGGDNGPPVVKGKSKESLLYKYLIGEKEPRMPPNEPLAAAEIKLFQRWIDEGAKVDKKE